MILLSLISAIVFAGQPDCPKDTTISGASPPEGTERGCVKRDKDGNTVRHGWWVEWYMNGQKQKEGEYIDGRRSGKWLWWYPNGLKMQEGKYWDDKPVGVWSYWDEDGKKQADREQKFAKPATNETPEARPGMEDFSRNVRKGFSN